MLESAQNKLYDPRLEHDACGIGAVVSLRGIKTHQTVDNALKIVEKLEHRAGKDAAGETGDGVGLMIQIPHKLMVKAAAAEGITLGEARDYGVGMFFFPTDDLKRAQAKKMLEIIVAKEGMEFLGWRDVPTHPEVLGEKALGCMPCICQCFVKRPADCARGLEFDRKLYVARRVFEQSNVNTYIPSFSSRTIVYKGMFLVGQLRKFYADLQDPDCESAIALVHSRFSTNTNPSWERAHPNRYILHNGEINTIRGNVDRMLAREETMHSAVLEDDMDKILPVVDQSGSDSSMLDNTLEFLLMNGIPLPQAVMMCIPEPWVNDRKMSREKRDFYHYYATMMEPWDGPAAIVFSDGDTMGAVLDRNGLRPCRWYLTDDDYLILSSEVGVLDIPPERIVKKSRLQPGRMLLADLTEGRLVDDEEIKEPLRPASSPTVSGWTPTWCYLRDLPIPNRRVESHSQEQRDRLYKAFGYTYEEVKDAILPMARDGSGTHLRHGCGHAAGGALGKAPAPVQLLQAALRPGDQSPHGRHPGGDCHRHHRVRGLRRQPAGGEGGKLHRAADPQPHPHLFGSDEDPLYEPARLPGGDHLPAVLQGLSPGKRPGPAVRERGPGLQEGRQHPDPLRPGRGRKPCGHPLPAGGQRPGAVPGPHEEAHRRLHDSGERGAPGRPPLRHPSGLRRPGHQPLSGPGVRGGAGDPSACWTRTPLPPSTTTTAPSSTAS